MRAVRLAAALVCTVAVAAILASCGGGGRSGSIHRVAMVTRLGENDIDWTVSGREAFEAIVDSHRMHGEIVDATHLADPAAALRRAAEHAGLVIVHDVRLAALAGRVAAQTDVPALVWGDRSALRPGLVGDVEVDGAGAGYVAGIVGALSSPERRPGILIARDGTSSDLVWNEMAGGFIAGARSRDRATRIAYAAVGPSDAAVRRAAQRLAAHGADPIFVLGGHSNVAAVQAIAHAGHHAIGVIGDKWIEPGLQPFVISAVAWNFDEAFRQAVSDVRAGRFGRRPYVLSIANRGLSLLQTATVPVDGYAAAVAAERQIARGSIAVPVTKTADAVRALLHSRRPT